MAEAIGDREKDGLAAELGRRRRFLEALNWGWLSVGLVALVSLLFYREQAFILATIIGTTVATFLIVRWLASTGRMRAACILFALLVDLGLFAIFLALAQESGVRLAISTEAPALMMMGLAILFAGALVDPRAPFFLAVLNSLLLTLLVVRSGSEDPRFSIHIFWWLLALISWLYERTLEDAFAKLSAARRNLQDLVDQRTGELQQTVERLSNTMAALEASNRELDAFASAVSHDLRAPVRSIIGFSDALHDEHRQELSREAGDYLARVRRAGRRMHALIDDLLRLSRISRPEMRREEVDLSSVGLQIVDELRRTEPDRTVEYRAPERVEVEGDPRLLQVLLENLIGNAWKFTRTREEACIELGETELHGKRVCFVRDNGVGFDMSYSEKLFRPFQRLHSPKDFDGTGIGLATAHRIIQRHGGRIWADAKTNEGASFYFTLEKMGVEEPPPSPSPPGGSPMAGAKPG